MSGEIKFVVDYYDAVTGILGYSAEETGNPDEITVNVLAILFDVLSEKYVQPESHINEINENNEVFEKFVERLVEVIEHETIHAILYRMGITNYKHQENVAWVITCIRNPKLIYEIDKYNAQHYDDVIDTEFVYKTIEKLLGQIV